MPETSHDAISPVTDPIDNLPLRQLRSEIVPPAPNRSQSSIDWLPDFAGYSWLAYGASTLLVISHLPSPLRGEDSTNGPFFRQILEVSGDVSSPVTSVSWSPVTPSVGELAVGSGNYIYLFARDSSNLNGSFCWSQNAILVQETKVEAIEWTGSGDGIIVGGTDIVLWKRRNQSWEIAWKFSGDHLQDLVSSTWSFEGPFATATSWRKFPAECDEAGKSVLAYYSDGESYHKFELPHPQRISMIQWRPMAAEQSAIGIGKSMRNLLMTCCLDGAVRLWSEVDGGKTKKGMKEVPDHKKSFCVAAVIEINQVLDGCLGRDLFLFWGTRTGGILKTIEGTNQFFSMEKYDHENVGKCEWLVGYGPGNLATLWAVHCLDDISPMRFPRVTLWAKQESNEIGAVSLSPADATGSSDRLPLKKVSVLRNNLYGTPLICSLIYLSPQNTVYWSSLHTIKSHDSEDSSPNKSSLLKCIDGKVLYLNGHGGKILQVAFDPFICEAGYTASLDSNGLIIIWSSSAYLNRAIDHPISVASWKPCGWLQNQEFRLKYTSLCWAPSSLKDERFLLVGHAGGVDCFSVRNCGKGDDGYLTHYICTIPSAVNSPLQSGPTSIFARPLSNSCGKTFKSNRFLLLSVWMKEKQFDALSWSVTLHHFDTAGSTCDCHFHDFDSTGLGKWLFEDTFAGKKNCIAIRSCSSEIPESHRDDEVTSFAVVNPCGRALENDMNSESQAYTMATGQADGSLKIWRSSFQESSTPSVPWELVGMLTIGQNPVSAISLTDSGHKIAALCTENHSKAACTISIWEIIHLIDSGVFILEDKLHVDAEVVAVRWSIASNDQLLLGVCTQKELRVYGIARQPCKSTSFAVSDYSSEGQIWQCFAVTHTFSAICDLWWGPKAMTCLVHNDYISLHGQWLAVVDKKQKIDNYPEIFAANLPNLVNATEEGRGSELLSDSGTNDIKEADTAYISRGCIPLPSTSNAIDDGQVNSMSLIGTAYGSDINEIMSMEHMVEKLGGALPLYHPQALLVAIHSGNWKRASAALRHLSEYITSSDASEKGYTVKSVLCPDILLSKYYEGSLSTGPNPKDFQWGGTSGSSFNMESYSPNSSHSSPATDLEFSGFCEQLKKFSDGGNISRIEKLQYFAIADLLCEISNPHSTSVYASLDEAGRRFWVTLRFKQLFLARSSGKTASLEELHIDSSMIGWAFQSESQENLSGSLLPNEASWQQMRSLGFGFWYSNVAQLRSRMEKLARQQYLKNKNPKDCALLYIALNRVQVLAGLFKLSKDEKDKPLVVFLSRNFQEEKNKAAALKNAYVLMGKHQLELAIGFFLLGGEASSAINVCVKNLQDEQLALVICRLIDGQGGALESNLIKKHILPSAVQRGDFWLASLLKWELGEYHQSILAMAGCLGNPVTESSTVSSNHISFVDPSIGLYCLMLATKNSVKNAVGEKIASTLSRWATLMAATAFSRCGLPLEALECLSVSASGHGGTHQTSDPSNGQLRTPQGVFDHSVPHSSNWVSSGVSSAVDTHFRLRLAVQFLSRILREATAPLMNSEIVSCEKLSRFQHEIQTALEQFYQRFSLSSSYLRNMMILSAYNRGLLSMGHNIFQENSSSGLSDDKSHTDEDIFQYSALSKLILKATEEKSFVLSRIIAACSVTCFEENKVSSGPEPKWSNALRFYFQGILESFSNLRTSLRLCLSSSVEDLKTRLTVVLDLVEYCTRLAIAWVLGDVNCLFRMVQPLVIAYFHGHMPYEVDLESVKRVYHQEASASVPDASDVGVNSKVSRDVENYEVGYPVYSIPEDERCLVTQACFWKHVSDFVKHKLGSISINLDDGISNNGSPENFDAQTSLDSSDDIVCITEKIMSVLGKTLISTLAQLSSYHVKQLVLVLKPKLEKKIQVPTLLWLLECRGSQANFLKRDIPDAGIENENNGDPVVSVRFWKLCVDPHLLYEAFLLENFDIFEWSKSKPLEDWSDMYREVTRKNEGHVPCNQDGRSSNEVASLASHVSNSSQKAAITANENSAFQNPKEIHKRTGELIEALCINAINHRQAALASNRKGIIFFNLEDGDSCKNQSDYIWSDADWPHNGWANSESTPIPTCVSLGVGLGDKKGAHLGLGGATVGVVSISKPGKAHRLPGYSGLGVSGLGWETQEEFEEFVDPPPTVETVITRAFSNHPTMPLFLVGSSNTHIYLWEFGKDRATATYGVLPAANVPPPYALASISAVQFGPCGHRFASAALDGTVCTWQSEVGGRSNIHPVESSLCFNGHASDVEYISSSGSIVAASGYSSSGANVVVWDTLAPPSTSQASINCHEGGARSISVFDNDIGSGSISPMIVTGGKNGDVGLHDFRYIATGKMKKQRNPDGRSSTDGDQNKNGMLWYIPKTHLGSVTKIATIPRTSLFLTGSKDGEVKLWDAKAAKLIHHWPKLHERHTFLQPNSRGYGGIIRAGVTDIQVCPNGFITCGGDGTVKFVSLRDPCDDG
ncbi:WD40 repeat [Arabidopsis suecica]|uniref:WD40 repeat n=1 Tax=Arabidopsis suecica TaxID=45249 RepID=A0A8T2ATL2_ARASU|nr:WD40 repeat [Arabidopsis suecica]